MKQGRNKLELEWKGGKNEEVIDEKTWNCRKQSLIWAYFFEMYLNYLNDERYAEVGYGFPLVPLETYGSLPFEWKICEFYVCIYTNIKFRTSVRQFHSQQS